MSGVAAVLCPSARGEACLAAERGERRSYECGTETTAVAVEPFPDGSLHSTVSV